MYILMYSLIFVVILFLTKTICKSIKKANILFTGMWSFCASLSSLGLYGIYTPSVTIHFYSITAIFIFNLVFLINTTKVRKNIEVKVKGLARLNTIYLMNIICWVYIFKFMLRALDIISSVGFSGLRAYAFDSTRGLGTTIELMILQWVVQPVFISTILISMVYIALKRKNKILVIVSFINVTLYTITFGGRALITTMILFYVFTFIIVKSNSTRIHKKKKINLLFIIVCIVSLIVLTLQRSFGDTSFIESLVVYFAGPFSYLEAVLSHHDISYSSSFLYGSATFGFILNLFNAVVTVLYGIDYSGSDYIITQITAIPHYISPSKSINAITTMLYPFLRDFGYFGIIIGTAFLAWVTSWAENKFIKNHQLLFLCVFVYFLWVLFNSVMMYQLLFPRSGVTLLLLLVFINSKRDEKKERMNIN